MRRDGCAANMCVAGEGREREVSPVVIGLVCFFGFVNRRWYIELDSLLTIECHLLP